MRQRLALHRRLTFANVVACLALFCALGGTSAAADSARGVTRLITGSQVKDNSLTGADVRNGSLQAKDFRAGDLPAGQDGADGQPGAAGPSGASGATGPAGPAGTPAPAYTAGFGLGLAGNAFSVLTGTTGNTLAAGDDPRLSDARNPTGAAGGALTGTYPSPALAFGAVTSNTILDGSITGTDIGSNQVTAGNIGPSAVNSGSIVDGSVSASDLATGSVTTTRIAAGAVDTGQLAAGSVNSTTLAGGAVTYSKMASDSVDSQHLVAGSVGASELAPGAVTGAKVADRSLSLADLDVDRGAAVLDPPTLLPGMCTTIFITAPAAQSGDLMLSDYVSSPGDAMAVQAMTATASSLRFRVCNRSAYDYDDAPFTISYLLLH